MAKDSSDKPKKRPREYGYCSECQKTVLLNRTAGKVPNHELPGGETCPGSGGNRFTGVQERCAVCDSVQEVRDRDGRIVSHTVHGQRCDGSGRSPAGGRHRMNVVRASTVNGGAPSLGKRR